MPLIVPLRRMIGARVRPPVVPGSTNYGAGTVGFLVPEYNTLTITLWGAGGGGSGLNGGDVPANSNMGGTGGSASFSGTGVSMVAGGGGGSGSWQGVFGPGVAGGGGGASGGNNINSPGGGNSGGAGFFYTDPDSGNSYSGYAGGPGGLVRSIFTYGAGGSPVPGTSYTVSCGGGGAGCGGQFASGGAGSNASASISWS
jgi:hypothetical protein